MEGRGSGAADAFALSPVIDFISGTQQFSARFSEAELLLLSLGEKLSFKDVSHDTAGASRLSEGSTIWPPLVLTGFFMTQLCPRINERK